jgi:dienelactone hydrolase
VAVLDCFASDRGEPLGLWVHPAPPPVSAPDLRAVDFEYASRGDRVPGRLLLPPRRGGPRPLVLLQHGASGSKDAPYVAQVAAPWVRGGAAVATIDFPLHGERANAKLSAILLGALGAREARRSPEARRLLTDFVVQAVADLQRALDAAAALPEVDAGRSAYAGLSLGAIVGATFCGIDPRPCAAALALGGGDLGWREVDPVQHLPRFAPRPLLFVNMKADERVPPAAGEALYAAAGEPKQIVWFDGGHLDLPGRGIKAMWQFLAGHLGLVPEVPEG